jgi:acyl carrier protein
VNRTEILEKVAECIRSILDLPNQEITMRTTAEDIEGWDSFNHINIVVAIENQFGVKFNTSEVEEVRAVGEFVKLIEKKLAARK